MSDPMKLDEETINYCLRVLLDYRPQKGLTAREMMLVAEAVSAVAATLRAHGSYPHRDGHADSLELLALVRSEVVEECAKAADQAQVDAERVYGVAESVGADIAARRIRRLIAQPPEARPIRSQEERDKLVQSSMSRLVKTAAPSPAGTPALTVKDQ